MDEPTAHIEHGQGSCSINWNTLKILRTLNLDCNSKHIALECVVASDKYPEGVASVLLVHRQGFEDQNAVMSIIHNVNKDCRSRLQLLDANDIYYRFLHYPSSSVEHSDIKFQLIHPATPQHVAKYTKQTRVFVAESVEVYLGTVLPWIERQNAGKRLTWIENIFCGNSEQDRILASDPDPLSGWVLLPDSKWDQRTNASLYLLLIARNHRLRSVRDLNVFHLPMLRNMKNAALRIAKEKYDVEPWQLRLYFHYLPTYFCLHLHVVHVDLEGVGCTVGSALLLDDVIDNISSIDPNYYSKRTLYYTLGEEHPLFTHLKGNLNQGYQEVSVNLSALSDAAGVAVRAAHQASVRGAIFNFSKMLRTVPEAWNEWKVGIDGQRSVEEIYREDPSYFKRDNARRMFYFRRSAIINAIERIAKEAHITEEEAISRVENYRAKLSFSLNQLQIFIHKTWPLIVQMLKE